MDKLHGLQVRVLGSLEVLVDQVPLRVDTRKALAIVAVVAIDGPQARESLAALLWPESAPERARGALRRTLSVLRRGLDGRWLVPQQTVALAGDGLWSDVDEVTRLTDRVDAHADAPDRRCERCVRDLASVAALHRGDLLEGFGLRDSTLFDDWRAERAEHLRRRLARTFDQLTSSRLRLGDLDGTLADLERWLVIDPLNEHVHTRLMLVHAWRGERAEAMRRYRACVATLDVELGVAPLPRTTQVYRTIVENRLPPPATAPPPEPATPRTATSPARDDRAPLVGRDQILQDLLAACAEPGSLVVVTGETGVGKSRLADALQVQLQANGQRAAKARCFAGEHDLAFGPFVDLLRQLIGQMPRSRLAALPEPTILELHRLVPAQLADLAPLTTPAPLESPGARVVLFGAIWEVLDNTLSGHRPGAIILDELHAMDPSSLELLGYGLRRRSERAMAVVLCLRPEDAPTALSDLLGDPTVAAHAREVTLPRLSLADTTRLVGAAVPDADTALAARLHAESEGLPLLLVEYLRLVTDGQVEPASTGWTLPHRARELARSRLARLSDTAAQVASAAAAVGRSFDLEVVRAASGRTEDDVVDSLDELLERRIVRELTEEPREPRYDFVHDKLRAAIYDETSLARRTLLHGRIADALAPRVRREPLRRGGAAAVAHHARLAGRDGDAAEWHVHAAAHARTLFANAEARTHLEQALALGHPATWDLRLALGELDILLGDYAGALATLEAAAAQATDDRTLAISEHRIAGVHLRVGELVLAESHLTTARALVGDDDAIAARIEADLGLLRLRENRAADAAGHARTALDLAERCADLEGRAQALNLLGAIARHHGDLEAARAHLAASVDLAGQLTDPTAHVAALNNLALATAAAGDVEEALRLQQDAVERGARQGDRHREAALRNNLADLLHRSGRDAEAMEALQAAVELFASIDATPEPSPEVWKLVDW